MTPETPTVTKPKLIAAGVSLACIAILGVFAAQTLVNLTGTKALAQNPAPQASEAPKDPILGKKAPSFSLPDQNDKQVKLSDSKGKWTVLAFYPADMTGGCTLQNRSYTEHIGDFAAKKVVVYTISTQDTTSKRAFCSKEGLKHTLLADVGGTVAKQYGAMKDGGTVANRWTYYIDPKGKVAYVDHGVKVGTAAEDSLAILDTLAKEKK